jgi:ketosteroid isomerase-like protein
MTIKEYLAVPAERRVICYTTLDSTSVVGPYKNEYVWFLRFDEEGKKITEIVEFLDSKAAAEILSKVQEVRGTEQH